MKARLRGGTSDGKYKDRVIVCALDFYFSVERLSARKLAGLSVGKVMRMLAPAIMKSGRAH